MQINDAGLALIKAFEGCSLTPYRCPAGILTIGWGHAINQNDAHFMGDITQEEADSLLLHDLEWAEKTVTSYTTAPLNENQFSALVSFVFNAGPTAFRDSTMRRALNAGQYLAAANEFPKWVHAGGQELPGLVARRAAEKALFLTPVLVHHDI